MSTSATTAGNIAMDSGSTAASSSTYHKIHHSTSITNVRDFNEEEKKFFSFEDSAVEAGKEKKNVEASSSPSSSPFLASDLSFVNACSRGDGARVLFATDEWFAAADNLIDDSPPAFDPDLYCPQGKVMDGWESRRRREAGHDWCVIKLSRRCQIVGVEIDTAFFTGNQAPRVSLEIGDLNVQKETEMVGGFPGALERLLYGGGIQGTGCSPPQVAQAEEALRKAGTWTELLPISPLQPGYEATRMHYFRFDEPSVIGTHVRVNYFPDGGVARLRLWSHENTSSLPPKPKAGPAYVPITTGAVCTVVAHDDTTIPSRQVYKDPELSLSCNGGVGLACSNRHYGEPSNLIRSTLGKDMGDGWETARHPNRPSILVRDPQTNLVDSPLSDWAVLKLGIPAGLGITRIILDTKHFKGNYPESVQIEGCCCSDNDDDGLFTKNEISKKLEWFTLIPRCRMAPDSEHVFEASLNQIQHQERMVTHVRVSIYPDGGLSRVRVYGPV